MATAKLLITDEVNVKIEGLDLHERKELSNKFKYEIPGARYLPAVRLGRWSSVLKKIIHYSYVSLRENK